MNINPEVIEKIAAWRADPVLFVRDNFKVEPDEWQKQALMAFVSEDPEKRRIALSACAGPGKSACLAWCALLFISCYCGEKHPVGAVVSATWDVLQDTLWKEIAIWMRESEYLSKAFKWTKSRVSSVDHPESWYLLAKTYRKSADENEQGRTLQGLHSTHIAYFIDESGDMGVPVLQGAEQGLSNCVFGKIITAGNPTSHTGLLHHAAVEDDGWFVINITGDPEDPMRSPRIDIDHARKMIEKWGRDDVWVMAYILGQFPKTAINTLLAPEEVREAIERGRASTLKKSMYEQSQKRLGVDVALYGDDNTVIFPRQGLRAFKPVIMRGTASDGQAPARIAGRILEAKKNWGSELEFIDCTGGYGDGVVSYLRDADADPVRVVYSAKASNDTKYYNKRTENYFRLRDWVRNGGILPNEPKLVKGLSSMTYTLKNGKLCLEPKDNIKARLKRSPDEEDALSQTFSLPEAQADFSKLMPGLQYLEPVQTQSSDWDPFK